MLPDGGVHVHGAACAVEHVGRAGDDVRAPASTRLADHTTLRVGGEAERFEVARTAEELVELVQEADAAGTPLLILGGGSNVLIPDDGFPGTVVLVANTGVSGDVSTCGGAVVTVGAGENWDDFVAFAVEQEFSGIESLSGIPGSVGATPIQNVGAYGSEIGEYVYRVRTYDRETKAQRTFMPGDCRFEYRNSIFKRNPGRYVVLDVMFQFELGSLSAPVRYGELAKRLGVQVGERVASAVVRDAVLDIRAGKGMVLNDADHDTWSAGSFFTNPILTEEQAAELPADAPRFPAAGGLVKTSAAWLIQHSGFEKGYTRGNAGLSTKHVLALTNRGGARATELVGLARVVRDGVEERMGVRLVPEVNIVGAEL
ncbi:MAG: UDP-N-acetylmuramate dehydrogenase [Propionibacterium sp.]|nr:UDP-N-acetylmuramate dehydrogenase [Propionibacterium sp.]